MCVAGGRQRMKGGHMHAFRLEVYSIKIKIHLGKKDKLLVNQISSQTLTNPEDQWAA